MMPLSEIKYPLAQFGSHKTSSLGSQGTRYGGCGNANKRGKLHNARPINWRLVIFSSHYKKLVEVVVAGKATG
jgi:hypothetical protein